MLCVYTTEIDQAKLFDFVDIKVKGFYARHLDFSLIINQKILSADQVFGNKIM